MAVVTYTFVYSTNLNLEIAQDKPSGVVSFTIRNTTNNAVVVSFTQNQLIKLQSLVEDFNRLRNNSDLVGVVVT